MWPDMLGVAQHVGDAQHVGRCRTTELGYGTTNADAGVGIGMLKGDSKI